MFVDLHSPNVKLFFYNIVTSVVNLFLSLSGCLEYFKYLQILDLIGTFGGFSFMLKVKVGFFSFKSLTCLESNVSP